MHILIAEDERITRLSLTRQLESWGHTVVAAEDGEHVSLSGPADPRAPFGGLGKIAALGIKVSRHCAYHGVALNVAMDLEPFSRIDPCGYAGLQTVDLARLGINATWRGAADRLAARLANQFTP